MSTPLARAVAQRAAEWLDAPPDYDSNQTSDATSTAVRRAVQKAMGAHQCDHYTRRPGLAALCQAVATALDADGVAVDPDSEVVITGGVREARYVALHALALQPDQKHRPVFAVQPGPEYVAEVLALAGLQAEILDPDTGIPTAEQGLILLRPSSLSEEQQATLADWAATHDITVIADETDRPFSGDTPRFATRPGMSERTLTLGSFHEFPGLMHWQVAWFAGPKALAQTVRDLKQAMTICSPAPAQYAALAAIKAHGEGAQ